MKKYFLIGKTNDIRRIITSISQYEGEQLYETWERLKDLLRSCPHHAVLKWQLVQSFYESLTEHQGLQILSSLLFCRLRGSRIKERRRRIKGHVQGMWINNHIFRGQEPYYHVEICRNGRMPNSLVARQSGWNFGDYVKDDDERFTCCMYCRCDDEIYLFGNMLQGK
jgi:hypothetical protein